MTSCELFFSSNSGTILKLQELFWFLENSYNILDDFEDSIMSWKDKLDILRTLQGLF